MRAVVGRARLPVRILMLSDVCYPRVNGVSTSIRTFRRSLAALGHESVLVAPEYPADEMARAVATEPGEVVRVRSRRLPLDPEDRLMSWRALVALEGDLARRGFDVLHVHTPFAAHYAGLRLARRLGLPLVETYHTFFEEYLHHYLPLLPAAATRALARRITVSQCRPCDALVVPSPQMLAKLREYGVTTRAEVLPTGLEPAEYAGGDGAAFRARHGIAPGRPVLVHVSRVAHEKNIDFVLRAFGRVLRDVPDALLVVAGEGPALGHLRGLARSLGLADRVRFIGYLDRATALLDCYRAGDAFVFASRTETQGLVLLEALALGVPVVSTAVMGTADVLRGAGGAVIAPDDETGFAAAVVRVLRDPELRARLAAAGPADARAWSATALAERLAGLYADVARRPVPAALPSPAGLV